MKLALNSATFLKLPTWLSLFRFSPMFVCKCSVQDFSLSWEPNLRTISSTVTFQAENWHLAVLLLFQDGMQELYMPWHTQKLQLPCKVSGTLDQVDSSLDLLISVTVPKSTRSEDPFFFQFSSPFSMCTKCWQGLPWASSPSKMYLSYMRLYIVQQFIIFTENVEMQTYFCQKLVFISCPIQMLWSYTNCTIF